MEEKLNNSELSGEISIPNTTSGNSEGEIIDFDPFANTAVEEATPDNLTPENIGEAQVVPTEGFMGGLNSKVKSYIFLGVGIMVVLLVFFIILSFFLSRNKKAAITNEKIVINYWGLWEKESVYGEIFRDYEKANPNVKINYIDTNIIKTPQNETTNYLQKIISRIGDGSGPDIFRFHNTWLPILSQAKVAAPLPKAIMKNETFESLYYDVHKKDLKIGDSYYGLPLMIDGLVLVYNKELLSNVGINVPQTWEEVQKASAALTVVGPGGNITTSGFSIGATNVEHFSDIFGFMLLQNGGNLSTLANEEGVQTLKAFRQMAMGKDAVWSENLTDNIGLFIEGKVAMIMVPSWQIASIKQANPNLAIGTSTLPRLPGGDPLSISNYWVEGVSSKAKSSVANESWKLLKFMSLEENLKKIYSNQMKVRAVGSPYPLKSMRKLLLDKSVNNYSSSVMEHAPYFITLPTVSRTFDSALNDQINRYLFNAVNETIQGVSYEQALTKASVGINTVLKMYNIKVTQIK